MSKRRSAPGKNDRGGADRMVHHLALDRFEENRDGATLAVLVTDDGHSIVVPPTLLPDGAAAGMTLALTLTLDPRATAEVEQATRAIRADLKKTDPGGTIQL